MSVPTITAQHINSSVCNMELTTTEDQGLVSVQIRQIFELVNTVILSGLVSFFGIVSNIINAIIFYKQGLGSTMNISFFALAISDLFTVTFMEWITICFNPLLISSLPQWDTPNVAYLSAAWLYMCFGRLTCWITTYVTAERCLCIAMPLKVKQIITPKRTTFVICFLYFINLVSLVPFYASSYLHWVFSPDTNASLLTIGARENKSLLEPVGYFMYAVLGTASFPVVIVFTAILVYKLRRQRTWRIKSSSHQKQKLISFKREVKTMKMVVLIAAVLIACYTPGILASLITSFVPSFNINGVEKSLFLSIWSLASLLQTANSSVNIFLYYKMSTNYKQTFVELFNHCKCTKAKN